MNEKSPANVRDQPPGAAFDGSKLLKLKRTTGWLTAMSTVFSGAGAIKSAGGTPTRENTPTESSEGFLYYFQTVCPYHCRFVAWSLRWAQALPFC